MKPCDLGCLWIPLGLLALCAVIAGAVIGIPTALCIVVILTALAIIAIVVILLPTALCLTAMASLASTGLLVLALAAGAALVPPLLAAIILIAVTMGVRWSARAGAGAFVAVKFQAQLAMTNARQAIRVLLNSSPGKPTPVLQQHAA